MAKLKAILFDLDDTLVVDEAVSQRTFEEVSAEALRRYGAESERFCRDAERHARRLWESGPAREFCRNIGISAFECLWGKFEGSSADLTTLREWAHEYRAKVFESALRDQMIEPGDAARELSNAFETSRRRLQRLMPDAREVLSRLQGKYKIALLTNGAPDLQREKIAASGLAGFFDAIAVSGEKGIGKPRPEIFYLLLEELGVTAAQAVMVGNSMERDIAGARNAGLAAAIWLKVPGSEEHADTTPHHTITGLHELPQLITKIEAKDAADVCG